MEIYHNPRCQKSRQTLEIIQESGEDYTIRKYLEDPPTREELQDILVKLDLNPKALVRQNEALFKEKFKNSDLTDDEWLDVLVENPRLIQRPIVIQGDRAVIGRPPDNVRDLL